MTHLVNTLELLRISHDRGPVLETFITLFLRWNERINLSAARSREQVEEHVVDSLHVVCEIGRATRVVDVGSGGGFPLIPAAICLPEVQFTALEPVHKKHAFLRTAARELQLANVSCLAQRVQDHEDDDYDVAMSRATFDLVEWLDLGTSVVRVGGCVLGFEAVPREDLPSNCTRSVYELHGKRRAIVKLERAF